MIDKFILDENRNVVPATLYQWGKFLEEVECRVVKQEEIGNYRISTVFIGIDHWWGSKNVPEYKPHIFETMIFNPEGQDIYLERCSTWAEAETMHEKAKRWLEKNKKES